MLDSDTISLIQSFSYAISQGLIASAIVEWKKLKDDSQAQENAAWLENVQHSKALNTSISEKINLAFRQLNPSREYLDFLLPLAADPLLNAELTKQIVSDAYSEQSIVKLVLEHQPLAPVGEAQVKLLSSLLVEAIRSAIAEDPQLCRVKQLQFQSKMTEDISDIHKEMSAGFTNTQAVLNQLPVHFKTVIESAVKSAMADCSQEAEHLKSQNQKRFDRAREELIHGSIVVAEKEYRALVADLENLGPLVDKNLLFRSYTNLGSSLWQQFLQNEAVGWFDKAYATQPGEQTAKTNKAAGHIHRKEFQAALAILNELKATSPDCFEARYLISYVHLEQGEVEQAILILEDRCFPKDDYFEALAQTYMRREDFPKATEAARNALAKNGKSKGALMALANSLGLPLVQRRMRREAKAFSLTEAERQQVLEAIHSGETAVKILRAQDRSFQLGEMLTNLSAFYELVGNDEDAAKAAEEAAACSPQNITTVTNLWASQMRLGKYADAYNTAGKLIQLGARLAGKLRQLESLLLNAEHGRLLQESANDPELTGALLNEPRFFSLKAHAQFEAHQIETAFNTIEEGLAHFPGNARLHGFRASLHADLGQLDAARADFERAEESAEGGDPGTLLQAGMFYFHQSDWSAAAQRFVRLGADSIHSPFLDNYLVCLHNLGQFLRCFELSSKAIDAKPKFNLTLYELAARCAYNANDLPNAEKFFEKLVQHNTPKVVEHQKMLAQVFIRLDEPEKAASVLKKAYARKPKDIDVLIGLSFVSSLRKQHKEAIGYTFAAVQTAGKNQRAHTALVRAALDCPADVKIDDKQRKAFQHSFEFLQKHPSGFIKTIPLEKDLKSFIAMAKARAEHAHRIEDLIRDKNLPMSILAEQLGLSPFQTWLGLIGHSKLHVQMAYGTTEEQVRETQSALSARAVCVDAFALFSLRLLNHLDLLPKLYPKIYVHTAIFEAVVANIREMETGGTGMTISYREGSLVRTEVSPEQIEKQLSSLRDIRDFLKSPAVELVGLDAGFASSEDVKKAREILGVIYYEPLLVSKSRDAVYYSDDAPMRSLAANSHGVASFCTQAMLRAAKEKKLLMDSRYEDAVITLLRHNYHFVSESVETLARLAGSESFQPSELAMTMLGRVTDPKVDQSTGRPNSQRLLLLHLACRFLKS